MEKRIAELEKRVAALEVEAQKRREVDVNEVGNLVKHMIVEDLKQAVRLFPTIEFAAPEIHVIHADAFALERHQARQQESKIPKKPWG